MINKSLTKAEEQIMQTLWKLEKAYLKNILDALPEPKPHNNTVATLLKILIDKEFVANEVHGRNHYYYPLVSKQDYTTGSINNIVENYFDGSFKEVVSFMIDKKKLDIKDIELLLNQLKTKK
ncbi:MAG TPA: BlaI/MecI/CopY family transcriptional regulator [Saprospiraceae bacterium]|nr:BlaI/MecI/CopY family transcriptional regulator [Saprospiraceae bacterium]